MSVWRVTWENVSLGGGSLANGVNVRKCQYEIFEGALRERRKMGVTGIARGEKGCIMVSVNLNLLKRFGN